MRFHTFASFFLTLSLLAASLRCFSQGSSPNFVYETKTLRLTIDANGKATSLFDKLNNREILASNSSPFASIKQNGKSSSASGASQSAGLLRVSFGDSAISANYRVTASPNYLRFEVVSVTGSPDDLRALQLQTILQTPGAMLAVQSDEKLALAIVGTTNEVETTATKTQISASVHKELGLQGKAFALIAAAPPQFLDAMHVVESDFHIPYSQIGGAPSKLSTDVRTSYLFTDLSPKNVDETIRLAKLGGFRYILIYASTWAASNGSYPVNSKIFAEGEPSLKAVVDQVHKAGLKVGLHMLSSMVQKTDPLAQSSAKASLLRDPSAAGKPLERSGGYLADLRTDLPKSIAQRISTLINTMGFDMIYMDAGELNSANGDAWYWEGIQQSLIFQGVKHDLLVQGSGTTPWTWHIFSRGTCDDYAAIAPKQYLDYHKIADSWTSYRASFLPAELGWTGLLSYSDDHPATLPDEMELYAVRMLALDTPFSLETSDAALHANGRAEEILKMIAAYENMRLNGSVPSDLRNRLRTGEWHLSSSGQLQPIRYDEHLAKLGDDVSIMNTFPAQPLKFRLEIAPALSQLGDRNNRRLLSHTVDLTVPTGAITPGTMIQHADLGASAERAGAAIMAGVDRDTSKGSAGVDLSDHRALAVTIESDGNPAGGDPGVLNVQLEAVGKRYRDYYVDLNFAGRRTVIIPASNAERMLPEFRPASSNYPFKSALYSFDYKQVVALNLRWMRAPRNGHYRVTAIEALQESPASTSNLSLSSGTATVSIPGTLAAGNYAESWADGAIRIFDRNGFLLRSVPTRAYIPLSQGSGTLHISGDGSAQIVLTAITLGR